ncbi:MAG: DUF4013 domain-containing protein [Anaerolineaceae bacterium]|nr:DUF4013 domain-containing protein [Anaerolineaceae bacterium]
MNFSLAFTFAFKDADWIKKIGLVALVSLIPVIGQLLILGFALEIMKRVINNDPVTLPELDFGGFLGKGFQALIIGFVYGIPLFIIIIPTQILPFLVDTLDADLFGYLTIGVSCLCGGLAFIYAIVMGLMLPAAYGNFIKEGSLGAAFRIGEVFGLVKAAPVAFLIAIVGTWLANLIVPFGVILCVVGVWVTMALSMAIMGHFYGQAYNQAVQAK